MKNKIIVVSNMYPSLSDQSYGSFVKEQYEELEKRGINIKKVVSYDRAEGNKKRALFKYISLWSKTILSAFNLNNKVYHFHYVFPTAVTAPILKLIFRKKIVFTFHGSDLLLGGQKKQKILSYMLSFADQIILVSDYLESEFSLKFPKHSSKTNSINCGVNTELFKPANKDDVLKKLNLKNDKFNILFLGRIIKDKGSDTLLNVIEELKENKEFQFIVVGDGQEKKQLESKFSGLENVVFHPSIPKNEVPNWFNAADVFLFPTKREAFGLVALESLACGTPAIANNVGGVPEIIKNEHNGFLINFENKEYVEKIVELYNNPSKKNKFAINGYKSSQEHSIEKQINKIIDVYQKL